MFKCENVLFLFYIFYNNNKDIVLYHLYLQWIFISKKLLAQNNILHFLFYCILCKTQLCNLVNKKYVWNKCIVLL